MSTLPLLPKHEPQAETAIVLTPMQMIDSAVRQGADIDKLSKLMDLQERWEKNEARKAFVAALATFKSNPPTLDKNKLVSFQTSKGKTEYRHATLDHVANVLGRALSQQGLSFRWNVEQVNGKVRVTCILQHSLGHGEQVTMEGPADDTGNKNAIQQVGSTVTYLERYTLLAATGMATVEQDDDGERAEESGELMEQIDWILSAKDIAELQRLFVEAYKKAQGRKDQRAMAALLQAKNRRKAELQ